MRLRHVFRRVARSPLFACISILTVALGIGANTAVFSVLEGVLLKPLPYANAEELLVLDHTAPGVNIKSTGIAPFQYFTYRDINRTFQDVAAWDSGSVTITGVAEPEQVPCVEVTDGALPMLGVRPVVGRVFSRSDDSPGTPETVILTFDYWQRRFGG